MLHHLSDLQVHTTLVFWIKILFTGQTTTGVFKWFQIQLVGFKHRANPGLCCISQWRSSKGTTLFRYTDVQTFGENSPELNVTKTIELCCEGRDKTSSPLFQLLSIQVQCFKYLWTKIDTYACPVQHTDSEQKSQTVSPPWSQRTILTPSTTLSSYCRQADGTKSAEAGWTPSRNLKFSLQ